MATQNYPDGFPGIPSEAINFSYFLSESEKNEWRDWLATASEEQKEELVDILHSMWQDNQKNAVPESFANNIVSSPQPFQEQSPQPPINQNFNPTPVANFQPQPQPQTNPFPQPPQPFGNPQNNQAAPAFFGDYPQPQNQPQQAPQNFAQPQPQQFDHFSTSQNQPIPQNNHYSNQNPPAFNQNYDFNNQNFPPQPFQEQSPQPPINQNFNPIPVANFQPQPQPQTNPFPQPPQPFGNPQNNQAAPAFFGDYPQPQNQPQQAPVANFQSEPVAKTTFAEPSPAFNIISPKPEENFIEPASFPLPQASPSKPEEKLPSIKETTKPKENPFVAPKFEEIAENKEEVDSMDDFIASSGDSVEIEKEVEKSEQKPQPKPAQKSDTFKVKDNFDLNLEVPKNDKNSQPKKKEDISMESLVKDNKYRPNPLLDNADKENKKSSKNEDLKFEYKPKNNPKPESNQAKDSKETKEDDLKFEFTPQIKRNNNPKSESNQNFKPKVDQKTRENSSNFSKEEKPNKDTNSNTFNKNTPKNSVSFSDLKESGTKEMLNEIYQDYVSTYDTNQRKFMSFLERITKLLSNYESITDHFEDLTKRLLKMNDTIVSQAKDIQQLKNNSQVQGGAPIQDQIDDLRYDLDKLEKEVRILRTENRRKFDDVNQQLAAVGADNYKESGVIQKIELLKSEIKEIKEAQFGTANNIVKFNRGSSNSEPDQQANNAVRFNQNQNRRNQDRNRQGDKNSSDQQSTDQAVVKKSNLDLTGIL